MMDAINRVLINDVCRGNIKGVKLLLESGYNPNETTYSGASAISFAVERNDIKMVQLLIEAKCNLNERDAFGFTPLELAQEHKYQNIVDLILKN
jgi:ankyrin repeat protein